MGIQYAIPMIQLNYQNTGMATDVIRYVANKKNNFKSVLCKLLSVLYFTDSHHLNLYAVLDLLINLKISRSYISIFQHGLRVGTSLIQCFI